MLELHYVKLTNMGNQKLMNFDFLHAKNQNSLASNFPTGINRTVRIGNFCGKCVTEYCVATQ